jgi:hypothetical protein
MLLDKRYDEYEPLDWRFPTRHNIWTPIETIMNRELSRHQRPRIDDRKFFIRNAVESPENWKHKNKHILAADIEAFQRLVEAQEHQPFMILTFGQRAFEFARRSQGEDAQDFSDWGVPELSTEFDTRSSRIRDGKGNLLPLLHAVIARQFETCHTTFRGNHVNYYEYIGCTLASILQGQFGNERLSDLWM